MPKQRAKGSEFKFTPASVRAARAPDEGRATYYDAACNGLALRVSPNGERVLYAKLWQSDSKRHVWEHVSAASDLTEALLKAARARVIELRALMSKGTDLATDPSRTRDKLTFGALVEDHFKERRRRGDRAAEADYASLYQRWLGKVPDAPPKKHGRKRTKPGNGVDWTNRAAASITSEQVEALLNGIGRERRISGCVHELISAAYQWAISNKARTGIRENPAHGIKSTNSKPRKTFVRAAELPSLIEAIEASDQTWRDYWTLLLYVGYRRSAIARMQWRDVNLKTNIWTVPACDSKNGDATELQLRGEAIATLKRRAEKKESQVWVFPGDAKEGHLGRPKRAWDDLMKRADLGKPLVPHDLRRTLGSTLATQGASLPIIAKTLGHADIASAIVYTQLEDFAQQEALAKAHGVLENAAAKVGRRRAPKASARAKLTLVASKRK